MRQRYEVRGLLAAALVAAASGCALLATPAPAAAGTVRVEGTVVIFTAGNNETNTLVVNPRGAALDPSTGQFVQGFTVSDSTAPLGAGAGCRLLSGAVVCDIANASLAAFALGDRNDEVSQQQGEAGEAVPMFVRGGAGKDVLRGGSRDDRLEGGLDDDTLDGGGGSDALDGGLGRDVLTGGSGSDSISAGAGKDTINARDGEADNVNCGLGGDSLTADAVDTKKRCN